MTPVVFFGVFVAGAAPVQAQAAARTAPKAGIEFDHLSGKSQIFTLDLRGGETFSATITNTCPDAFEYSYAGLERGAQPKIQPVVPEKKPLETKRIEVVYDDRFGGYIFSITPKPGKKAADVCNGGDKLGPASFIVSIRQESWNLSFSGGFTVSGLSSPVFAVKSANTVKTVIEDKDKEDTVRLGAASFVHLYHDGVRWGGLQPALAFGVGINGDNRAEYLLGGGLRFGDKATVNAGVAFGSIARLPNGISSDTPVDDNVLNNLGTRVVPRWFVALTYAFIDTKDRLLKPFAQEPAAAASGTAQARASEGTRGKEAPKTVEAKPRM